MHKLYRALVLILKKPYLLNKILDDNDVWQERVQKQYGNGDGLREVRFHDLAGGEEISVKPFSFLEGGSLPTDLALLRVLAAGFDDCKFFEIGTWRGESVANVAEVAGECTTLNLSAKEMLDAGLDPAYVDQHGMFSKGLPDVIHLEGNSKTFDFAGLNKKYDLIFIDGDHHFESVKQDTENVFNHLLHEKSIVVWHDYAWQPGNVRYETLAAIMGGVPKVFHENLYAVRNTLCAICYHGDLRSYIPSNVAKKDEAFEVRLKA
ncbi:MAG: class I SAM-dependent methyltransferase [Bacteroidales bacterium]|nr:class I SAM-dependent methyltransferase [Bacteroidales bacterium]